ncbi:hypothetical protein KIF24_11380 [Micromonospora sp. Llam7]|uniref:hypothetical protein n=1 Tax=Micromonospora tarapacensis TaxID=2835305 RepID=UPI001C832565|nr:hypothetical protein [Micromonospora tarapacensis]MBX7266579.1 hypothetical protein [Micromonospora tarapacensis]
MFPQPGRRPSPSGKPSGWPNIWRSMPATAEKYPEGSQAVNRISGIRRTAGLVAVVVVATMAAVPAASAASSQSESVPVNPHCVVNIEVPTTTSTCHPTLRAAVAQATGGRVEDAPHDGAEFDGQTLRQINQAGSAARAAGEASRMLLAIEFTEPNYQGRSLSISAPVEYDPGYGNTFTPCMRSDEAVVQYLPSEYRSEIRSFQTFNYCYVRHYDSTEFSHEWYANDRLADVPAYMQDKVNMFILHRGPTRQGLLSKCDDGAETCSFTPDTELLPVYNGWRQVAQAINCSDFDFAYTKTWTDSVGGSIHMSFEVGVTGSGGIPGLAEISASVSATFGQQWNWSSTTTDTTSATIPARHWYALDRDPEMQTVTGHYNLTFENNYWGRKNWQIKSVTATGPVPDNAALFRARGAEMTATEFAQNCSSAAIAARRDGTAKQVPGTYYIDPKN